jgi:hypothetical protein
MTNEILIAHEYDAETGETTERPLSAEEIADLKAANLEAATIQAQREAKAAARVKALAKLKKLGLTEEEIAAL